MSSADWMKTNVGWFHAHFHGRKKLYRVGSINLNAEGLWYDKEGQYTGLIHTVEGAAAAALPMGHSDKFRADGKHWISVTDKPEALTQWFSIADMKQLIPRGYCVMEIEVDAYRRLYFDGFQHEVFCKEDMVDIRWIDPSVIYGAGV